MPNVTERTKIKNEIGKQPLTKCRENNAISTNQEGTLRLKGLLFLWKQQTCRLITHSDHSDVMRSTRISDT